VQCYVVVIADCIKVLVFTGGEIWQSVV